jgi:hypothetical protein
VKTPYSWLLDPEFEARVAAATVMYVHPGNAHMDDYLSVALLLALNESLEIRRESPEPWVLESPRIIVADVGQEHNPETMCFDHHQERTLHASFALILQAAGVWETFRECYGWAQFVSDMDTQGPYTVCRNRGIPEGVGREFLNPLADFVLEDFESHTGVMAREDSAWETLRSFGIYLWSELSEWVQSVAYVDKQVSSVPIHPRGDEDEEPVLFLFYDGHTTTALEKALARRCRRDGCAGTITRAQRNAGWRFYRLGDHPQVDFSVLGNNPSVAFAHRNGFLAETHEMLSIPEMCRLLARAICPIEEVL